MEDTRIEDAFSLLAVTITVLDLLGVAAAKGNDRSTAFKGRVIYNLDSTAFF
jgi:hypothetical protein